MHDLTHLNENGPNKYATLLGIEFIEMGDGCCRAKIEVRDELFHPGGVVHGGVAFSLADSTMATGLMAACGDGRQTSTIELKISFLAPVRAGTMFCESRVVKMGKRVAFMEADVTVGEQVVAKATASFAILNLS